MSTGALLVLTLAATAAVPGPPPRAPGIPEVLTFRLEDGRHQTPGLSLSFGLPGLIEYECRRLAFRQARHDREIEIAILGVVELDEKARAWCRMAKEPAPAQERVLLPAELGSTRVTFVDGSRRDSYVLAVTSDSVTLEPVSPPAFTRCEEKGNFKRVEPRWLWVDLSFLSDDSLQKMRPKRDELLHSLETLGAKPLVPPPGRYVMDGFVRQIPAPLRADQSVEEERFFLWAGDWKELEALARRYQRWAHVDPNHLKRPVMTIWFSSRDNVFSTYGLW
jgi:hypothetical protein